MADNITYGTSGNDIISGGNGKDTVYGGGGDDIISGGNGVDTLFGEDGNDQLTGDNGADHLTGGADDDVLDGSNGFDTAYYSGNIGEYSFFSAAGYLHVLHFGGIGPDGHDRLIRVERLVFADRVIDIGSGKNRPVAGDDHVAITEDTASYNSGAASVLDNDFDFDGDPLTVTAGTFVGTYGTLTLNANGTYSYTLNTAAVQGLDDGESVTDSFNYTVTDNDGSDTGALVFHIAGLNDAPVANDDTASTTEDAAVSGNVLANDTDVDGEPLIVANPGTYVGANGTLVLAADGSYTYTPNAATQALDDGESVSDTFSYTASDGTASDTATLTITVNGVNDAPVANDDSAATTEDGPSVSGNVLTNDTDVDGETVTVANPGTYVGTYGTLVLAADGSYTYTPGAAAQGLDTGEIGQDVFTYAATDGTASDSATLTINLTGLNDAPVANDDTAATDENSPVSGNVLANDTDVDGETLFVANPATFIGAYGTLVLAANGSYTYTPGAGAAALGNGEFADDVFTYVASDGTVTDNATLTITIAGLSGVPDAIDDTASTSEDSAVSGNVLANDTDPENDPLTVTNPGTYVGANGTLVLAADGSYTYTPNAATQALAVGESVSDVFSYTATDGGASDSATLTVTVNGANDDPVANDDTASAGENSTVTIDVLPNDTDVDNGAVLSVTAASAPAGQGSASVVGNQVEFDPGTDFDYLAVGETAVVNLSYTVSDEHGGSDTGTIAVTVTGANDAPNIDAANTDATGAVTELPDGSSNENNFTHQTDGVVAFDDPDLSDIHSASFTPQGLDYLGTFTLDPVDQSGDTIGWNFEVDDSAIDFLENGETLIQTYTILIDDGNGGTTTQDVTVTITGPLDVPFGVWFIDNSAVGSANLGTQSDPYTSIAAFNAAQGTVGGPEPGHTIYLREGTGTYAEADGINLLAGQILIGGGEDLVVGGDLIEAGTGRPTIVTTGAGNHGVELSQNNTISGFDIGTTTGAGIADGNGSVGTLSASNIGKSGNGQILDIDQGGTVNVSLNSAASTGSTGGAIDLNGLSGSFSISGATTITGVHSGGGLDVTASTGLAVSLLGTVTASTGSARAVNFVGNGGGSSLDISGGGMTLTTTTGSAFVVQNGGTVTVSGTGNSITSTTGSAVNITNATIGAGGVTLQSTSANGGSLAGIILDNAGSGGFTVTGIGSTAGSGGTINNKTGADGSPTLGSGVIINNTANVSLANMVISNDQNFGIIGTNVTNFTLRDSSVTGNHGNNAGLNESAIAFTNLTGTALFEGNVISGGFTENLRIVNTTGSLDLTIRDSADDQAVMGLNNNLNGRDSIFVSTAGTASLDLLIDGVDFLGARGDLLEIAAAGTTSQNITVSNNNFANAHANTAAGGGGVLIGGSGTTGNVTVDYVVDGNSFTGARGSALTVNHTLPAGTIRGAITDNVVGINDGVSGNQGSTGGEGIAVSLVRTGGAGPLTGTLLMEGNEIYDVANGISGIFLRSSGVIGAGALLEVRLDNNVIEEMGAGSFTGLYAQVGTASELGLILTDNVIDASGAIFGVNAIYLDQTSTSGVFNFPGYSGSVDGEAFGGTASADLDAFLTGDGNVLTNGGFPSYPGGVDASFVQDITNLPFEQPFWP